MNLFAEVFRHVSQREVDAARAADALIADLVAFCLRSVTDREIARAGH